MPKDLYDDFGPLKEAVKQALCEGVSSVGRLLNRHPEFRGQLLCLLSLHVAKTKSQKVALHVLSMARRWLVDNFEWQRHCILKEFAILQKGKDREH